MSQTRIWGDNVNAEHNKVEQVDANVLAAQQFQVDMSPQDVEVPPTRFQRKTNRIFGSGKATSGLFVTGFQMGAAVGGTFGGLFGVVQAVQTRNFVIIPVSMIASGVSFGFFMGIGMTFRAGDF